MGKKAHSGADLWHAWKGSQLQENIEQGSAQSSLKNFASRENSFKRCYSILILHIWCIQQYDSAESIKIRR